MTKGPWKYQKSHAHHHVLLGQEVLDVQNESDAKAIAQVPSMIDLVWAVEENDLAAAYELAHKIIGRLAK